MNRLWNIDGLSRKQYNERNKFPRNFDVLECDFPALMARSVRMMQAVRYFNSDNRADGFFYELFRFQPLVVLTEIRQMDTCAMEQAFRLQYENGGKDSGDLLVRLAGKLDEWDRRLAYCRELRLTKELRARPLVRAGNSTGLAGIKKEYYSLLECVRKLQQNYDVYLEGIGTSGKNDPAIAVLKVFLQNYSEVAACFNERWSSLPSFYFEKILHAGFRKPLPDVTWLVLKKGTGDTDVKVDEGTAFIAGKNSDNTLFCYRSSREVTIGDMEIERMYSYFLERDPGRFPAARLDYVTAILRNEIDVQNVGTPQALFGGKESRLEPVGIMIESPMFLLREGCRTVSVSFSLTKDSVACFEDLVSEIAEGDPSLTNSEIVYKLLNDAFYLEISVEDGWKTIPEYVLNNEDGGIFRLVFRLNGNFPATAECRLGTHGRETAMPALRILMNRNAWLYPYSWAGQVWIGEMTVRTEVTGITDVKLYNTGGELDASVPGYPFGVQPERGAWFVFGNYETAFKPLKEVSLVCHWLQLPVHPEGFYGYYRDYRAGIDNLSFRVRMEWLNEKRWQAGGRQYLFMPDGGGLLLKNGPLPEYSRLQCRVSENMPLTGTGEEAYIYGRTRGGFVRVVLEEPAEGFGHVLYRQIFAETMIASSKYKKQQPLPNVPVSPMTDGLELSYVAEETVCFAAGQAETGTKLYHICPLAAGGIVPVVADRPVVLAEGPEESGNLLLGFRNAEGGERVRFFVDIAPLQREIDSRDAVGGEQTVVAGRWYINNGREWEVLALEAVLEDSTGFFMNSGAIEILLPAPVGREQLDPDGLFWVCATFPRTLVNRPPVQGIYMNAVEVVSDTKAIAEHPEALKGIAAGTISSSEKTIPGITGICQIVPGRGGRIGGDRGDMCLHLSDRIAHRNRALLPGDYERLVLEYFPQVMKVKCLPGLDSKGKERTGIVTLVIVPRQAGEGWPLATNQLLAEIECRLQELTGKFVVVDAVNPVYEEMTVRCRVTFEQNVPMGEVGRRLVKKLDENIVPWKNTDGIPVFGYRFSLQALQNVVMETEGIALLHGLSVLHVTERGERIYSLDEYSVTDSGEMMVGASNPWCIAVPSGGHLIEIEGEWRERAGVGKLEIGKNLVIQ